MLNAIAAAVIGGTSLFGGRGSTWSALLGTPEDGRAPIDAPRHQAIIGRAGKRSTQNLTIDIAAPFASVQIASRDGRPLARTDQILLLAAARVANADSQWVDDTRQPVKDWGHALMSMEPVAATLILSGLDGAKRDTVEALDGHRQPMGGVQELAATRDGFSVKLGGRQPRPGNLITVVR